MEMVVSIMTAFPSVSKCHPPFVQERLAYT